MTKLKKTKTVEVTERALIQRINRALAKEGEVVKSSRLGRGRSIADLGRYYMVDTRANCVVATDVDLAALGKEMGLLRGWETVETVGGDL